jgi:arylsulfatase A-like enzyme
MYGWPNMDFIDNMYITRKNRGKGTAYESGVLVPLVIRGPQIGANTQNTEYAHAVDLFSTILELAKLTPPHRVSNSDGTGTVSPDSVSLAPVLFNKAKGVHDPNTGYILTETIDELRGGIKTAAAQNATYKVLCSDKPRDCLFYNLISDPLEEYPLAKPESCSDYSNGKWNPADPQWHYCRLKDIAIKESFIALDWK